MEKRKKTSSGDRKFSKKAKLTITLPSWMSVDQGHKEEKQKEIWNLLTKLDLATVHYLPKAVSETQCQEWLKQLNQTFVDLFKPTYVTVWNQTFEERRRVLGFSREDKSYVYSGKEVTPLLFRDYPIIDDILTKVMKSVRTLKEYQNLEDPDFIIMNWYRDGKDYISPHSDDETSISQNRPIVSLSLGATRTFAFYPKTGKTTTRVDALNLTSGSICIMGKGCQTHYKHGIPESKRVKEARWNLTFRWMK